MGRLVRYLRAKAMGLAFTVALVLAGVQVILPTLLDVVITLIVIGLFWLANKLKTGE